MNANELADELLYRYADEGGNFYGDDIHKDVIEILSKQQTEIEKWKRKYKDMHNLATQAMSRVHELEKGQEK